MENSFLEIFNVKFLLISLMIFGLTEVIKRLLSYEFRNNRFIKTVALPSLAIIIGGISGLIIGNFISGIVAGVTCSLIFGKVKRFLKG